MGCAAVKRELGDFLPVCAQSAQVSSRGDFHCGGTTSRPVSGFGERIHRQRPTQATPFTKLVDAARPDPPSRREVARLVDGFLADAPAYRATRDSLLGLFKAWRALADSVSKLDPRQPMVADARIVTVGLARLTDAAATAVARLAQGVEPDSAAWAAITPVAGDATKPLGLVRLEVGGSLRKLLLAAYQPRPSPGTAR